ncbi:hypothetical protein [Bacteroides gallinarum]|uniref:hypothetical protein n=1 Tax=Bacteroides gallinarum TaxID=376806 RepID=UPI0004692277|nr:hypothetical protein [Bacteroides gallinarum]
MKVQILFSFFISLFCFFSSKGYSQIGQWYEQLDGSRTVGHYDNYQFLFPKEGYEERRGLELKLNATGQENIFFQLHSLGKLTFGSVDPSYATFLNLKQGTYVYACLNTVQQNFNIIADRDILFKARNSPTPQLQIDEKFAYLNTDLTIKPRTNPLEGDFQIKSDIDNNMLMLATYSKWMRIAGKSGIALWGNDQYQNVNPTLLIGDNYVRIGGQATIKPELINKFSLFVRKGVLTEDFSIAPSNEWADFVFLKDYKLPHIYEVEKEIQKTNIYQMYLLKRIYQNLDILNIK